MCLVVKGLIIACLISGIIGVATGLSYAMKSKHILVADNNKVFVVSPNIGVSSILAIIALGFNLCTAIATFFIK
ncbi:unnamed protein product [Adineta steineri]|uniref:Uncharacterized protein n=1 Tax=Adineta steineri TaxID=433720 RepID=A0A814G1S6_9BILA|nr:unnamed protein product [Adineta steineri]CAF0992959.1 unnamed protein product [Adineta steineri]